MSWVERIRRLCPVSQIAVELVRFDLQKEMQPEISGVAYQQGELAGYEVREYLLEKWGRACANCEKTDTPLQIEHIVAKANGGSDRVANLTLACNACNQRKGKLPVEVFLKKKPALLKTLLARAKAPLRDAAAVNSTRWARVTADGFKRGYLMREKKAYGFRTGDLVEARVPSGKKRAVHIGRVAIRATGSFNVQTSAGVVQGISHRNCRVLQRGDGYGYNQRTGLLPALKDGVSARDKAR